MDDKETNDKEIKKELNKVHAKNYWFTLITLMIGVILFAGIVYGITTYSSAPANKTATYSYCQHAKKCVGKQNE